MLLPGSIALTITNLTTPTTWTMAEFRLGGLPVVANPFDPDTFAVDATFKTPSGRVLAVPGFWYQAYQRRLQSSGESLSAVGAPEWRLRFTPPESGTYELSIALTLNGEPYGALTQTQFTVQPYVPGTSPSPFGFPRVATHRRYLETDQGTPLPLIGSCVCWPGARGTYDYDDWFGAMQTAGENYARLWMAPWAFAIEAEPGTLTHYRLDRAWQLDYVLALAERRGLYLMPCLDYHGMFEVQPDYWGGNNYWPKNPYNVAQGGPCTNQNAFFTNTVARATYQKRLRYLVARYSYSPHLLAWQLFNEIDNVYQYLNAADVAVWHGLMGDWLHTHDPYRHLVTTSFTGGSDRPEVWRLSQMDFSTYHSYGLSQPAAGLPPLIDGFLTRYQKPVLIDEYGVDWRGWARASDPYLRGWRQGLWAAALGGSVGTAMSWWWENLYSENVYPAYRAYADFVAPTGLGSGDWTPVTFQTSGSPPYLVGDAISSAAPYSATLTLSSAWGAALSGRLAVTTPLSAMLSSSALDCFVQGTAHPDLRIPFQVQAWFGTGAQLTLHVNSVSNGAIMAVIEDGIEIYRQGLPNLDGTWQVNNEYNRDFTVSLSAGKHTLTILNRGVDWFYLDWIRLDGVLPSQYAGNWQPSPIALGLKGTQTTLLYVVNPAASFPANATNAMIPPLQDSSIILQNFPAGRYLATWQDPQTAQTMTRTVGVSDGIHLALPLPSFSEDGAGRMVFVPDFYLRSPTFRSPGSFQVLLQGSTGWQYAIESSPDLTQWQDLTVLTNASDSTPILDTSATNAPRRFYRARLAP